MYCLSNITFVVSSTDILFRFDGKIKKYVVVERPHSKFEKFPSMMLNAACMENIPLHCYLGSHSNVTTSE